MALCITRPDSITILRMKQANYFEQPNPDKPEPKTQNRKASLAKAQRTPRKSLNLGFKTNSLAFLCELCASAWGSALPGEIIIFFFFFQYDIPCRINISYLTSIPPSVLIVAAAGKPEGSLRQVLYRLHI